MAWWLFQNVVVTALLAGIVALVCRTTRVGPVARHALWLIVLVKFVTPPVLVWPWAAPDPLGVAMLDAGATSPVAGEGVTGSIAVSDTPVPDASSDRVVASPSLPVAANPNLSDVAAIAWPWLMGVWIAGSAAVLGIEALRLVRVARAVRRAVPGPSEIAGRVARLSRELGLRAVPVITIAGQSSPAIWCAGRPRLLWPADMATGVTDACLDGLIVHELAHVQRRDHLVGWLELLVGVIWWWNPLFWYVRSALREQAELACDAWVISALPNGRRAYAESLLALSSAAVQGRSPALAAVIGIRANNRRVLERRLVMIMQGRASLRLSVAGLVALAVMALASLPAWATGQQPTTPPPAAQTSRVTPTTAPVPASAQSATPVPVQSTRPVTAPSPASSAQHAPAHPVAVTTVHQMTAAPTVEVTMAHPMPSQATAAHPVVTPQSPMVVSRQQVPVPAQASRVVRRASETALPADGQELFKKFDADRTAIELDADKKVEVRRAEFVKALQALQEQYTKAGKLDEAIAIRDYIKAGGGATPLFVRIRRE